MEITEKLPALGVWLTTILPFSGYFCRRFGLRLPCLERERRFSGQQHALILSQGLCENNRELKMNR
jgi:hypothetical protein